MPDYLNKNGLTYTEEDLIGYAQDDGVTLEEYIQSKDFEPIEPEETVETPVIETPVETSVETQDLLSRLESGDYDY